MLTHSLYEKFLGLLQFNFNAIKNISFSQTILNFSNLNKQNETEIQKCNAK